MRNGFIPHVNSKLTPLSLILALRFMRENCFLAIETKVMHVKERQFDCQNETNGN